ncbi:MAG: efflux RND transporter permease subunit [Acidimicrobiales bacterium]
MIGDAVVDDGPGLLLVIERFPWANTVETTQAVDRALAEFAPGLDGIDVDSDLFRPAGYLERSIGNVQTTALAALALAAAALLALFHSWRSALVGLAAMLATLVATGLVLHATDTTVDIMVLAGLVLALGMVIGTAVGDVDGIARRLATGADESADSAVLGVLRRTRAPLAYSTAVLLIALVPVLVMGGAAGKFLPTAGFAMAITLVVSLIVSVTLTPALSRVLLADRVGAESPVITRTRDGFGHRVAPLLVSPRPALLAAAVLAVVAVAVLPTLERDFVPELKQTDLLIRFDGAPGTSLRESNRIATLAAAELKGLAGVDDVGAHVGRAVLSDEVVNVNASELWVKIDPDAAYDDTLDAIRDVVQGYPGYGAPEAVSYSNERVDEVLRQPTRDLVVRVYGEVPEVLGPLAEDIADLVEGIDGTSNVRALHPIAVPTVEIEVDLDRAAEFEVKPGDVRRAAATLLSGIEVGSFFEEQKVFDVVVWSPPGTRDSVTSVENLLINTPSGDVVELGAVADVRVAPNQPVIARDAVSRYIDVVADVSGRGFDSVESDITAAVNERGLPFEYHARILGDRSDAEANQRRVVAVTVTTAIAIFLILQAAFRSWRLATLLFLVPPLASAGGIVALAISGGTYSIGSAIGLFAVYGITLREALSLIGRYESLQLDDGEALGADLVWHGLRARLAPNVMTLSIVALVMGTIVAFGDIAGHEVIRPAAIVVLGGLVSSAVVTLFVLPSLYGRVARPAVAGESLFATDSA